MSSIGFLLCVAAYAAAGTFAFKEYIERGQRRRITR